MPRLNAIRADGFFPGDRPPALPQDASPLDLEALARRALTLDPPVHPLDRVKGMLADYARRIGASDTARARIDAIGDDTVFAIAGQQAGLFGGPLYTLYKAMHAVRLAEVLASRTGRDVVPLFWIASDDHDVDEVAWHGITGPDNLPARIEYRPDNVREGMPVGDLVLDDGIRRALDQLDAFLGRGEAADRHRALLARWWSPGRPWCEAFAGQTAEVFAAEGLVMFDPRQPGAKTLFREIMAKEIAEPYISARLVEEAADALSTAAERRRAIRKPAGSTNLFLETAGIRYPLLTGRDGFTAGDTHYSRDELTGLLASHPERFSPGAVLRPVCQDAVLPTAALIAGPGERRYLGQLAAVYRHFGVSPAITWPRATFTVIDHRTLRTAEKEHIPPTALFAEPGKIQLDIARASFPGDLSEAFDRLTRDMDTGFDRLADRIAGIDPTLAGAAANSKGKALHLLQGLRGQAERALKATTDVSQRRLTEASSFMMPGGGPQERWFGMDAISGMLADGGLRALMDLTHPDEAFHRIVVPAE